MLEYKFNIDKFLYLNDDSTIPDYNGPEINKEFIQDKFATEDAAKIIGLMDKIAINAGGDGRNKVISDAKAEEAVKKALTTTFNHLVLHASQNRDDATFIIIGFEDASNNCLTRTTQNLSILFHQYVKKNQNFREITSADLKNFLEENVILYKRSYIDTQLQLIINLLPEHYQYGGVHISNYVNRKLKEDGMLSANILDAHHDEFTNYGTMGEAYYNVFKNRLERNFKILPLIAFLKEKIDASMKPVYRGPRVFGEIAEFFGDKLWCNEGENDVYNIEEGAVYLLLKKCGYVIDDIEVSDIEFLSADLKFGEEAVYPVDIQREMLFDEVKSEFIKLHRNKCMLYCGLGFLLPCVAGGISSLLIAAYGDLNVLEDYDMFMESNVSLSGSIIPSMTYQNFTIILTVAPAALVSIAIACARLVMLTKDMAQLDR